MANRAVVEEGKGVWGGARKLGGGGKRRQRRQLTEGAAREWSRGMREGGSERTEA